MGALFPVVDFSRGTLPQKRNGKRALDNLDNSKGKGPAPFQPGSWPLRAKAVQHPGALPNLANARGGPPVDSGEGERGSGALLPSEEHSMAVNEGKRIHPPLAMEGYFMSETRNGSGCAFARPSEPEAKRNSAWTPGANPEPTTSPALEPQVP